MGCCLFMNYVGQSKSWIYTELSAESFVCGQDVTRAQTRRIPHAHQGWEAKEMGQIAMANASPGSTGFTTRGPPQRLVLGQNPNIVPVTNSFDAAMRNRSAR